MSMLKFFISLFMSITLIMPANEAFAIQKTSQNKSNQYSTWLWDTSQIVKSPDKIINFLSANNVKNLYLQIDYDLKADAYRSFIKKASMKNISVQALGGSPDWVSSKGASKQKAFFDWLKKFQSTSPDKERFKGVHLDVEPYLNPDYNTNMNKVLDRYQSCLLNSLTNTNSLGLELSIDIPFWFDEVKYNTNYGDGILADWIIKNIKSVVIMAYRDSAEGSNGIINLVSRELDLGKQYNTSVTIAVETQKSSEGNYISFYKKGVNYMNRELDEVHSAYKNNSSFNGFAIHHVIEWMKMDK